MTQFLDCRFYHNLLFGPPCILSHVDILLQQNQGFNHVFIIYMYSILMKLTTILYINVINVFRLITLNIITFLKSTHRLWIYTTLFKASRYTQIFLLCNLITCIYYLIQVQTLITFLCNLITCRVHRIHTYCVPHVVWDH